MQEFPGGLLLSLDQLCKWGTLKDGREGGRWLSAQGLSLKNQAKAHKNQHTRHTGVGMALLLMAVCEVYHRKCPSFYLY